MQNQNKEKGRNVRRKKEKDEGQLGKEELKLKSDKIRERNKKIRYVKITLLVITLFLIIIYFLLRVVYATGNFTVSLDPNFAKKQRTYNV